MKDKNEYIKKFENKTNDKTIKECFILNEDENINNKYIYYLLKSIIDKKNLIIKI